LWYSAEITHAGLVLAKGDSTDPSAVERAIMGQEAVISALGPRRPSVPHMMEISARNIVVIQASDLDWTVVRFPRLVDDGYTGKYRVGFMGKDSGTRLVRADAGISC
jgi:hypothetical protein